MPPDCDESDAARLPVDALGSFDEVARVAQCERAHAVALAGSEDMPPEVVRRIGWQLESTGVDLTVAPAITEIAGARIHTRPVGVLPLMSVDSPAHRRAERRGKDRTRSRARRDRAARGLAADARDRNRGQGDVAGADLFPSAAHWPERSPSTTTPPVGACS